MEKQTNKQTNKQKITIRFSNVWEHLGVKLILQGSSRANN